ncbi:MAG: hypothetical protein V7727_22075 [Sneathiella sp.]
MKLLTTIAIAATFVLSACDTTTSSGTTSSPAGIEKVSDPLVGKRLVSGTSTLIINPDGTMGGEIREEAVVGTYTSNEKEICSTYSSPDFLTGKEFCSVPVIVGDTVVFNRRDGSQSPAYTIQN